MKTPAQWVKEHSQSGPFDAILSSKDAESLVADIQAEAQSSLLDLLPTWAGIADKVAAEAKAKYHATEDQHSLLWNTSWMTLRELQKQISSISPETDPAESAHKTEDYYYYTRRCECCGDLIDYTVDKKSMDHYRLVQVLTVVQPIEIFTGCEACGRMTLQKLVAYEHAPN